MIFFNSLFNIVIQITNIYFLALKTQIQKVNILNMIAEKISKLPKNQLIRLNSFKPLLKLSQNDEELSGLIIDDIEREAFKKGYLDVVILLDINRCSI